MVFTRPSKSVTLEAMAVLLFSLQLLHVGRFVQVVHAVQERLPHVVLQVCVREHFGVHVVLHLVVQVQVSLDGDPHVQQLHVVEEEVAMVFWDGDCDLLFFKFGSDLTTGAWCDTRLIFSSDLALTSDKIGDTCLTDLVLIELIGLSGLVKLSVIVLLGVCVGLFPILFWGLSPILI
jgi:hypothetical protein